MAQSLADKLIGAAEKTTPTARAGQTWFDTLEPDQQEAIRELWRRELSGELRHSIRQQCRFLPWKEESNDCLPQAARG